ncbi:MAG: DinB family protein [Candidatus Sumerlaeaceae bacterium]
MTPEAFANHYTQNALRTIRLVRQFEDKDFDLRPGPGSMSTAEQINHICASGNFIRGLLAEAEVKNEWFGRTYEVNSVDAAVRSLFLAMDEVKAVANNVPPERWTEEVAPWGPDFKFTRGQLALLMVEHEIHHNGQLHVYARMAGKIPVMLYHPVDEVALRQ